MPGQRSRGREPAVVGSSTLGAKPFVPARRCRSRLRLFSDLSCAQRRHHRDRRREAVPGRRRIGDLRDPVGIDIAKPDAAKAGVARRGVAGRRADAEQGEVVQDRFAAEEAKVAADLDCAPFRRADRAENLTKIDAGRAEADRRTAAVGVGSAGIDVVAAEISARREADVIAKLVGREAEDKVARQQARTDRVRVIVLPAAMRSRRGRRSVRAIGAVGRVMTAAAGAI